MSSINKKNKQYIFVLDVDTDKVDKKYDISVVSNIVTNEDDAPLNSTKLSELINDKIQSVSFLDESKKIHKCIVSMINHETHFELTQRISHQYNCFWDRHPFNTKPIGCPINYVSNKATKKYYSEITKDTYTINENIPSNKLINDNKLTIIKNGYYETDGVFCSFNCTMAFINENKHNHMYYNSAMLLTKMYNDMLNSNTSSSTTEPSLINPASHWRLLNEYGGNLSITEFRNNFNKVDYDNHGIIYPRHKSIGILYEQKLKF